MEQSDRWGVSEAFGDGPGSLLPAEHLRAAEVARRLFGVAAPVRVGHYEIRRLIGAGGMGQVFEAHDPRLQRAVALKILAAHPLLDDTEAARLRREARAMARLCDPHIVPVFDAGVAGGRAWIAMELVCGTNLRAWLHTSRTWPVVLDAFIGAARGLAAIHAAGLVHCDFKPANVMIDARGRARVTDFGLARLDAAAVQSDPAHDPCALGASSPGACEPRTILGGTPAYMAPEQHELGRSSAAADQYAFCVALHEALWGRARAGVHPAKGRPPTRLRRVLERGLNADPRRRFPGMHELIAALQRARARSRAWWSLAVVATLAVVLGLGLGRSREVSTRLGAIDLAAGHAVLELEARIHRGSTAAAMGDFQTAERALSSAYDDAVARGDDDLAVAAALGMLDLCVVRQTDASKIPAWVGQAESMLRRAGGTSQDRTRLAGLVALGSLELGDLEAAASWGDASIAEARTAAERGMAHEIVVNVARGSGRVADAREHARKALAFTLEAHGPDHPNVAATRMTYADMLLRAGDTAAAREHLTAALAVRERALGPLHPEAVVIAISMGNSHMVDENLDAAESWYRRALQLTEAVGSSPAETISPLQNLAAVAMMRDDAAEAVRRYAQAHDACTSARGGGHPECGWIQVLLARALEQTGDLAGARRQLREGAAVLDRDGAPLHLRAEALVDLGVALGTEDAADPIAVATMLRALPLLISGSVQDSIAVEQISEAAQWLAAHPLPGIASPT